MSWSRSAAVSWLRLGEESAEAEKQAAGLVVPEGLWREQRAESRALGAFGGWEVARGV